MSSGLNMRVWEGFVLYSATTNTRPNSLIRSAWYFSIVWLSSSEHCVSYSFPCGVVFAQLAVDSGWSVKRLHNDLWQQHASYSSLWHICLGAFLIITKLSEIAQLQFTLKHLGILSIHLLSDVLKKKKNMKPRSFFSYTLLRHHHNVSAQDYMDLGQHA